MFMVRSQARLFAALITPVQRRGGGETGISDAGLELALPAAWLKFRPLRSLMIRP
jgi:hypothetical protein